MTPESQTETSRRSHRGRKVALFAGLAVLVVACIVFVGYWTEIVQWYRFRQLFESLGTNEQGHPEYRHRETGIVFVRVPGGTFWMGTSTEEAELIAAVLDDRAKAVIDKWIRSLSKAAK